MCCHDVNVHAHLHTCTLAQMHAQRGARTAHAHIQPNALTKMHPKTHRHAHTYIGPCTHACEHLHVRMHASTHICVCARAWLRCAEGPKVLCGFMHAHKRVSLSPTLHACAFCICVCVYAHACLHCATYVVMFVHASCTKSASVRTLCSTFMHNMNACMQDICCS